MQPNPQPGADAAGTAVTITKQPDGSFMVNDQPAASLDEALMKAKELLGGAPEEDGMTVEQAFQGGFSGAAVR